LIFSGKAIPPKDLANDTEVIAYVNSHNDAIGYINSKSLDKSVKILLRVP